MTVHQLINNWSPTSQQLNQLHCIFWEWLVPDIDLWCYMTLLRLLWDLSETSATVWKSAIAKAVRMQFVGVIMCFLVKTIMFKMFESTPNMHTSNVAMDFSIIFWKVFHYILPSASIVVVSSVGNVVLGITALVTLVALQSQWLCNWGFTEWRILTIIHQFILFLLRLWSPILILKAILIENFRNLVKVNEIIEFWFIFLERNQWNDFKLCKQGISKATMVVCYRSM